ncbi:MAG TPA: nuclease domain-containing protein, partial [Myxococcales bacterium]|nr:nuclease domain-containing protein [Myxococcales bacterium]
GSRAVHLLLQPTFPRGDLAAHWGFKSVSGQRIPDLVVAWEQDGKRGFFILDAKYRVSRENVLDGMASAHIYRDALRWHGAPPRFALLLLPAEGEAPWLADPAFQRREGVGAVQIGDGLLELIRAAVAVDPAPRASSRD